MTNLTNLAAAARSYEQNPHDPDTATDLATAREDLTLDGILTPEQVEALDAVLALALDEDGEPYIPALRTLIAALQEA